VTCPELVEGLVLTLPKGSSLVTIDHELFTFVHIPSYLYPYPCPPNAKPYAPIPHPIPFYLAGNKKLKVDVPAGTVLTYGMVDRPSDSVLWNLREQQDKKLLPVR